MALTSPSSVEALSKSNKDTCSENCSRDLEACQTAAYTLGSGQNESNRSRLIRQALIKCSDANSDCKKTCDYCENEEWDQKINECKI